MGNVAVAFVRSNTIRFVVQIANLMETRVHLNANRKPICFYLNATMVPAERVAFQKHHRNADVQPNAALCVDQMDGLMITIASLGVHDFTKEV